ncbi:MAG: FAD-dependent oxidoreductase [Pirellulaceae bacterium]
MDRQANLNRLLSRREPWDLVVIGGGATGVGIALDARLRGMEVALIERFDFGKGTSSRSTKLVHGGVRCLLAGRKPSFPGHRTTAAIAIDKG